MVMEQPKEYYAFISYKREDEKWAKWLQHKLEHYKLPSNVRKGYVGLPKNLRPVFKDTSELASGLLADEIRNALEGSQYLIVICTPRAAQSEWVCKEVQTFIDLGRSKNIIPFIVGGKAFSENPLEECFPVTLRQLPKEQELLGVNINEMGKDAAVVKVIAQMLGLKFDTLWQRHQKEKARRTAIISATAVFFATVLLASLWIWRQNRMLYQSNQEIIEIQSRFIAEKINTLINEGDSYTATLLALNTLPEDMENPNRPYVPESESALRKLIFRRSALLRMENDNPDIKLVDVSFTTDGKFLVGLSSDTIMLVWDAATGAPIDTVIVFPYNHAIRKFGQREMKILDENLVCLTDSTVHMWKTEWKETDDSISSVAFSPDEKLVASVSRDMYLRLHDVNTGVVHRSIKAHDAAIRSVSFSPDGKRIATASADGTAKVWEITPRIRPVTLKGHQGVVYSATFSPDGKKVLTASADKTLKIWDAITGKLCGTFTGHKDCVRNAAFSPDGKYVASASYDNTIKVWDVQSLHSLITLQGHRSAVCSVCFSPDGRTLASVSWDNTVKLWDLKTGSIIREWEAHRRGIHTVRFSPDGKRLLTASWESTAKLWDVGTGRMVHELIGHTNRITSASFNADGTQIITSSVDGTIKRWDFFPLQQLIDEAHERFKNRQLTPEERRKYYLE